MEAKNDPYCGQKPFNGHSQLPWRQEDGTRELGNKVVSVSGLVAICDNPHWDAAFIVHLGNTYYPTRAALQAAEGRVKELESLLNVAKNNSSLNAYRLHQLGDDDSAQEASAFAEELDRALLSAKEDK